MTQRKSKRGEAAGREPGQGNGNQGEGNREADRRYREKATEFANSPRAGDAAREARRAVDEGELDEFEPGRDEEVEDDRDDESLDRDHGDVEREQPGGAGRERR